MINCAALLSYTIRVTYSKRYDYFISWVNHVFIRKPRDACVRENTCGKLKTVRNQRKYQLWLKCVHIKESATLRLEHWFKQIISAFLNLQQIQQTADIPFSQGLQAAHSAQDELWILFVHVDFFVVSDESILPLMEFLIPGGLDFLSE